jgi:hypothetical protein
MQEDEKDVDEAEGDDMDPDDINIWSDGGYLIKKGC